MQKVKVLKIFDESVLTSIFKDIVLMLLFYILGCGTVGNYLIKPFGFGMLFALILCKKKNFKAVFLYLVGNALSGFSLNAFYATLFTCVVAVTTCVFQFHKKKLVNDYSIYFFALLSQIMFIYVNSTSNKLLLSGLLGVILGLMFLFCASVFLKATMGRSFNIKLNLDEIVCGSIILIVVALCISNIDLGKYELIKTFSSFLILLFTYITPPSAVFLVASLCGIGYAIYSLNVTLISVFVCFALFSLAFKTSYKFLSIIGVLFGEVLFGMFFKVYDQFSYLSVVSIVVGGIIFMLLPKKLLSHIKSVLGADKDKYAIRSLVNRSKQGICKRMYELSAVFDEMKTVYKNMVKGVIPFDDAKEMLVSEITQKVCKNCPEKNKCLRVNGQTTYDVFDDLIERGFEKGRVNLLDVPQYLGSRCAKINLLLNTFNSVLKSYRNYSNMVGNMDASKVLIGEQLGGVSNVLRKLAEEINLNISFDVERENLIIEELAYINVGCREAIVYDENKLNKSVTLLVNGEVNSERIEKVVSKICKCKMKVVSVNASQIEGLQLVVLKNKPKFDIVFGSCSCSKQGVFKNGDAHSLIKLQNGQYLVALCDGMGSGEKAKEISNLCISLIESFYKAGFDNDIILSSVNKLLCLNNEENFSSVDLCVLDLHTNLCDFIKLGATYGVIKHTNGCEIVEGSNLPIGVLEENKPHITKKVLNEFDTLLLFSDGITDAFKTKEELILFISSLNTINAQTICEDIMDRAVDLNDGQVKDDMTVLAVRIFPN